MSGKRITLSSREKYVVSEVLAYMIGNASSLGTEGACLMKICKAELLTLRNKILESK